MAYKQDGEIVIQDDADNPQDYFNESGSLYPYPENVRFDDIEVDLKEDKMSIFELKRKFEAGKFITDPEFQRSDQAWKPKQKSMFIESLILNIPLPPFYFNQNKEGKFVVVDGLQRCTAIIEYLSGKYPLSEMEALPWLNGCYFDDLCNRPGEIASRIEDKNILFYAIKPSVPLPVIYDIFKRINTGGTVLQRQEIRNCIFLGKSTRLLKKLSENTIFKCAIDGGISPRRMKDREAILRCIAFGDMHELIPYKGDMDEYLGKVMSHINLLPDEKVSEIEN